MTLHSIAFLLQRRVLFTFSAVSLGACAMIKTELCALCLVRAQRGLWVYYRLRQIKMIKVLEWDWQLLRMQLAGIRSATALPHRLAIVSARRCSRTKAILSRKGTNDRLEMSRAGRIRKSCSYCPEFAEHNRKVIKIAERNLGAYQHAMRMPDLSVLV